MRSRNVRNHQRLAIAAGGVSVAFFAFIALGTINSAHSVVFSRTATSTLAIRAAGNRSAEPQKPVAMHIPTPSAVKAVYMSQCAAGTPSFREDLMRLIDTTELNSIVIDIRDYTGKIAFPTDNPDLRDYVSDQCGAKDMRAFVQTLHDKNMYVIGRITVFQNPAYTKAHPEFAVQRKSGGVWKDNKGLSFVDVGAKPYWDTVVELSKESYNLGFDELNFDYIRYPSDGPMSEADYTWSRGKDKPEALEEFYAYLHNALVPLGVKTSVDLFGMTATNVDDLNIGQVLERALPYFDYISPMVYPSHYPKGFHGYTDVNANAYNIVNFSMSSAVRRTMATTTPVNSFVHTRIGTSTPAVHEKPAYSASKMRPWLQSFDYPVSYTPAMVQEQS